MAITTNLPMIWAPVRKNPFLSVWFSAANTMAGASRGFWLAELHRHQATMLAELGQQTLRFWSAASLPQPALRRTPSDAGVTEASTALAEPDRAAERHASGDAQAQPDAPSEQPTAQLLATGVGETPNSGQAEPKARAADAPQRKASDSTGAQPKTSTKRPAAQLRASVVRRASVSKPAKPKARKAALTKRKARSAR